MSVFPFSFLERRSETLHKGIMISRREAYPEKSESKALLSRHCPYLDTIVRFQSFLSRIRMIMGIKPITLQLDVYRL
jgi:hypothetical protein